MNIAVKIDKRRILPLIFIAALFIRIIYIFQIIEFPLTEYFVTNSTFDQHGFDERALFIASGNWLGGQEIFGKEPLYSYFLAAIYKIFGQWHFIAYIIQAILTSLGILLFYKASARSFNRPTAYITSFILAFYSMSVFYDALLLRASLVTFLTILLFYSLVKAGEDKNLFIWFVSGAVLGLTMLARHNIFLPFILSFMLVKVRPLKAAIKSALIFIIGAFLVLSPVLLRNYAVSEGSRLCISGDMNAFWVGNAHNSSGVEPDWSPEYYALARKSSGDAGKIGLLFLNEIRKRPSEYLKLYIRKIRMFFNGYEVPSNTNYYLYRERFPTVLRWPLFDFQLICALGLSGLLLSLCRKKKPYLSYLFLAVLSASVVFFHILSRYRLPAVPFFALFASYYIYYVISDIRKGRMLKAAAVTGLAVFFYIILSPDLTYAGFRQGGEEIRYIDRTNLASAYIEDYKKTRDRNSLNLALAQCDLVIAEQSDFYLPYVIKGYAYILRNRYGDSVREYKKALVYENRNPFLYNEIAGAYYLQGSYKESLVFMRRALRLFPGNKVFKKNLGMIHRAFEHEDY